VEIAGVANRTRESGQRVAKEFGIAAVYESWLDLIEDEAIDAVLIGTWPYMHGPVTLAALENNKHVLTEARMAMDAAEAHTMLAASRANPHLVAMVVPAPYALAVDPTVFKLLSDGFLGDPVAAEIRVTTGAFPDRAGVLNWRQDASLSGKNIMLMGIWAEILMRWLGPVDQVMAMTKTVVKQRKDAEGRLRAVTVPDHVDILAGLTSGAQAHLRFSAATGLAPANDVWLYGTEGTIRVDPNALKVYAGKKGAKDLSPVPLLPVKGPRTSTAGLPPGWRVEEEFVNAIRGTEPVTHTSFDEGVRYMEFTEAVHLSAREGRAVALPL
jgi:predicted dehydrogenase